MKKLLFLSISALSMLNTYAQEETPYGFQKNDIVISGTLNYSTQNSLQKYTEPNTTPIENDSKSTQLIATPEIGYFLSNNLIIGAKLGYIHSSFKNNSSFIENKSNGFTSGVYGRYYFSPKKRISIFTELGATYDHIKNKSEDTEENIAIETGSGKQKNYSLAMSPGINIFLTKNLSLTSRIGKIGYTQTKGNIHYKDEGNTNEYENSTFQASLSLDNFYFGVQYRI